MYWTDKQRNDLQKGILFILCETELSASYLRTFKLTFVRDIFRHMWE